jgi:hypothetical protein
MSEGELGDAMQEINDEQLTADHLLSVSPERGFDKIVLSSAYYIR